MGRKVLSRSIIRAVGIAFPSLLVLVGTMLIIVHPSTPTQAASSFSFTAAGDYAQTSYTTANLNYIAQSGVSFHLALGDLNYDPAHVTGDQWSSYVKSHLPSNFPFEILAGNEDVVQLDALAAGLPDHLGNISGTYAKEYYFDYPSGSPLARFVLVSPGGILPGYKYSKGSAHYNWVAQQIDGARSAHIPWVIVGMHEYCIIMNSPVHADPCAAQELMNLLLSKKVDLILYGHKHNFQVSKQLALNSTTCTSLTVAGYNPNCVVNSTTSMTKGAGSVMVVAGTGGDTPLSGIDTSDPEAGYFRNWEGSNHNPAWGVSQFTISKNQLTMKFVPNPGGTFTDSFTITSSEFTPVPTPSLTPTWTPAPSPSPTQMPTSTPSPGTTLSQDTFQRADQVHWGTASDGQKWAGDANNLSVFSIKGGAGQIAAGASNNYNAVLGSTATDAEVLLSGSISTFTSTNLGAVARWTDSSNWYRAYIDGNSLVIQKKVGGTLTKLGGIAFAATAGTSYTLRFNVVKATLSAKVWQTSATEPTTWQVIATDSALSSGYCGLRVSMQSSVTARFTSFQATAQ